LALTSSGFQTHDVLQREGLSPNAQTGGPDPCIHDLQRQGDPDIPLGTVWLKTLSAPFQNHNNWEHPRGTNWLKQDCRFSKQCCWSFRFSGILHCVAGVLHNVLMGHLQGQIFQELFLDYLTLKMEALQSFETSLTTLTQHNIPEYLNIQNS